MRLDRCDQQVRVIRPPIIDLVVGDDLIFRLLQLHHLAEFGRLAGLALADDFRLRLEQTHELAVAARVAAQDARAGLFHHLSDERHHGIKLVAQALQRQLLYNVGRALHARGDFLREAFGLPRHPTGGIEQLTVGALEFLLALLALERAARATSSTLSFTLRLRSRSLVPASLTICVIFFMVRMSTRTPSPSKLESVGWWMLVSTTVVSTRMRRPS